MSVKAARFMAFAIDMFADSAIHVEHADRMLLEIQQSRKSS